MQTIKVKELETLAETLAKYVEEKKKIKIEHEQGEFELYLLRLKSILDKYNNNKEAEEIEVNVMEYEAFKTFKGGL